MQINNPMVQYRVYGVYIMRELNVNEIEQVNGGIIIPVLSAVAAIASHAMVRTFAVYVISRVGTITAGYGLAEAFGSKGGTSRNFHTKYSAK